MAVAIDATGTSANLTATSPASYTGLTVGSALSNSALIFIVDFVCNTSSGAGTVTATWDFGGTAQSMTNLGNVINATSFDQVVLFGSLAPTAGNKTLRLTWTNAVSALTVIAVSMTGVTQTSVAAAFANFNSSATTTSVAITSATGDMVFAGAVADVSLSAPNGTSLFSVTNTDALGANRIAASAGSTTMSWTSSTNRAIAGVDVVAAAGGGSTPFAPSLLFHDQPKRNPAHWIDLGLPQLYPTLAKTSAQAIPMMPDMPVASKKQTWLLDSGVPLLYPTLARTGSNAIPMMADPPIASKKQQWLDLFLPIYGPLPLTPSRAVPAMPDMPVASRKQQWLDLPALLFYPTLAPTVTYAIPAMPDVSIPSRKQQWLDLFLPIVPTAAAQTPSFALPMMEEMVVSYPSRKQQWLDLFLPIYGPLPQTPATAVPSMPDMPVSTRRQQWLDLFLPVVPVVQQTVTVNFVPGMFDMPAPSKKRQWADFPLPIALTQTIFAFGLVSDTPQAKRPQWVDFQPPIAAVPTTYAFGLVADMPMPKRAQWADLFLPIPQTAAVGPPTPSNFFDTRWFDGPLPSRNSPISGQFMFEMIGIPPAIVTVTAPHYNPFLASTGRMKAIW